MIKLLVLLIFSFVSCQHDIKTKVKKYPKKVVIAHREASGYLPEHTTEAKAMAYAMNPDYIEQDLVLSKDNVPIVIHDIYLGDVTDVAKKYPERSRKDQCILQCFDTRELERVRIQLNAQLFLFQLLDSDEETQQLDYFALIDDIAPAVAQPISNIRVLVFI